MISYKNISLLLFVFLVACTSNEEILKERMVQQEVKRRIDRFLLSKKDDCVAAATIQAEIFVDSVIYELTGFNVLEDSVIMISKPYGPDRPSYIRDLDTHKIVPFIEESPKKTLNDSL